MGRKRRSFSKEFKLEAVKLVKDGGQIDAITGATISSKAAVNAVRKGMEAGSKR